MEYLLLLKNKTLTTNFFKLVAFKFDSINQYIKDYNGIIFYKFQLDKQSRRIQC